MSVEKALTWLGIVFVVIFVATSWNDAGGVIHSTFGGIESAANDLATFTRGLLS